MGCERMCLDSGASKVGDGLYGAASVPMRVPQPVVSGCAEWKALAQTRSLGKRRVACHRFHGMA